MAQKPQEIIELEKIYGITLEEKNIVDYDDRNFYKLGKNGEIVAINLVGNGIEKIKGFEKLTHLRELYLDENKIQKIENLENLTNLQVLSLGINQITKIENLEKLTNLQMLSLNSNQISKIENLENFVGLQNLSFAGNQITKIENLEKLINLQKLSLYKNKITKIENLGKLTNLQKFSLSSNQITKIENLEKLTNLQWLYLYDNKITKIENLEKLTNLPNLKELKIYLNPFEEELENIKLEENNNLETLRNYFKLQKAQDKIEINLIKKVMLVGNHGSGKSTFLHYLFKNNLKKTQQSTHILSIEKYPKSGDTKAMFYDFGGQDYYHGIYKAFMTNEALNLIFWKNSTNNNTLGADKNGGETQNFNREYWISQIKHFGRENKSWLIQNHFAGDKREPLVDDRLQREIEDEYHVILAGEIKPNLVALKANLQAYIDEPKTIEISKSYNDFIANEILNHTSYEAVSVDELEKKFDNTEKINFRTQLSQLSLQGMVLYYKDVKVLEDVVWLNPQAIVKHIHEEVFEKKKMKKYAGIVPKTEFEEICRDERIRRMLRENKVIYFDSVENNYIIPSYLKRADKEGDEFFYFTSFHKPSLILKFEYFIPFGFINQLICHYGAIEEKKTYWRDMLLFTVNERKTQIFIKLDFEALTIEINVANKEDANKPKKIIKNIFDDICALYKDMSGYRSQLLPKSEKADDIEDRDKNDIPIEYPKDMYISLDGENFVDFTILNDEEKTQESILAYELEKSKINKTKAKSLFTRNFAYLATNNKGLNNSTFAHKIQLILHCNPQATDKLS